MTEHKEVSFKEWPKILRYSNILARLLADKSDDAQTTAYRLAEIFATNNQCTTHGKLEDPIVFLADYDGGSKIAFCCPWCSDPVLLAQWEAEPCARGDAERETNATGQRDGIT